MPVFHVDGVRPPMLLATGTADSTVGQGNTDDMEKTLRAHGSPVTVIKYRGIGHIAIILSLLRGFRGLTSLRRDMIGFIQSH
jgi:acetyl esterase/lipase